MTEETVFALALEKGTRAERAVFLDEACAGDAALRTRVEALQVLEGRNKPCAELVKLRFFAGLTTEQAAAALGIAPRTAYRYWVFARAWLHDALSPS